MDQKAADEARLRGGFQGRPKKAAVGDPWEEIAQAIKTQQSIYPNLTYLERLRGFPHLPQIARSLVRAATERTEAKSGASARVPRLCSALTGTAALLNRADPQEFGRRSSDRRAD